MTAYPNVTAYLRHKAGLEPPARTPEQARREQIDRDQARKDATAERMRTSFFGPALSKNEMAAAFSAAAVREVQRRYR